MSSVGSTAEADSGVPDIGVGSAEADIAGVGPAEAGHYQRLIVMIDDCPVHTQYRTSNYRRNIYRTKEQVKRRGHCLKP